MNREERAAEARRLVLMDRDLAAAVAALRRGGVIDDDAALLTIRPNEPRKAADEKRAAS